MREEKNKKPEGKKKTVARKSPFEKFFIKNNKEEESSETSGKPKRRRAADGEERPPFEKRPGSNRRSDRPAFKTDKKGGEERPSFEKRAGSSQKKERPAFKFEKRSGEDRPTFEKRSESSQRQDRPTFNPDKKGSDERRFSGGDNEKRGRTPKFTEDKRERTPSKSFGQKDDFKRFDRKETSPESRNRDKAKPSFKDGEAKPVRKPRLFDENFFNRGNHDQHNDENEERFIEKPVKAKKASATSEIIRLNKYVAQSGICSRRKAAELVKAGEISVNGEVNTNPAYETKENDVITYKGEVLKKEEKLIYLLLNKPKNFITTAEDEKGRKTVLDLVKDKYEERLFPVGRLDRNTTGLLLLTNDGALAKKLSHPSHQIKKIYQVELDKNLKITDLEKIKDGVMLEDGKAEVDAVDYIEAGKKNQVGIEIHSGKNRIVRRIFESLGYEVVRLDRTYFAGLTKKDLPRGFSRELTEKEIIMLRHFTNRRKEG